MFSLGDKVVCVNSLDSSGLLCLGDAYIVSQMSPVADEVFLVGVPGSWRTKRFILANQMLPTGNQTPLPSPNDVSSSGSNPTGYNPSSSGGIGGQPTPWVAGPGTNLGELLRTKYATEPSQQAKAPVCQHAFKPSRTTPGKTKWCSLCDHRE